jgi:hypothetical protein
MNRNENQLIWEAYTEEANTYKLYLGFFSEQDPDRVKLSKSPKSTDDAASIIKQYLPQYDVVYIGIGDAMFSIHKDTPGVLDKDDAQSPEHESIAQEIFNKSK